MCLSQLQAGLSCRQTAAHVGNWDAVIVSFLFVIIYVLGVFCGGCGGWGVVQIKNKAVLEEYYYISFVLTPLSASQASWKVLPPHL